MPACVEVGATLVAYSPLGRGMLSGRFKTETLDDRDWRAGNPRFQGEALAANVALVEEIEAVAAAKACSSAQVALAWVISRGEHVMAIPGTTKLENLETNLGAYQVVLSSAEQAALDALADRVKGDRYDEQGMALING
jgi:aryl-alcohol dehydrogenase-like predicted oxidoreductase